MSAATSMKDQTLPSDANMKGLSTSSDDGFEVDEVVLILNKSLWYKGKILEIHEATDTTTINYRVHYFGWSSTFDEWLEGESRLRKFTPENELTALRQARKTYLCNRIEAEAIAAQNRAAKLDANKTVDIGAKRSAEEAELTDAQPTSETTSIAPSSSSSSSSSADATTSTSSKSAHDVITQGLDDEENQVDMIPGSSIVIRFPANIRRLAIADWEAITKRCEIVPLPRIPSVSDILAEFAAQRFRGAGQQAQVEEVVAGLCVLFDRALPACLLYRLERPQYLDVTRTHPGVRPSRIYGAEHLLRLLLKLPVLLAHTRMDILEFDALEARVGDLIKWLQTRLTSFAAEYLQTDKEYRRRATILGNDVITSGTRARDSAYLERLASESTELKQDAEE